MSQQELHAATSDLFKSGKLSFDEISLSVGLVQSPLAKVNYDGAWPENYTKPMNFMSTLSDGLDAAKARGDSDSVKNITRLMSAFERVQGTAKS